MAGRIFINYRRGESLKDAQHLATLLGKPFGEKQIFLDVHGIDGGANWLHTLEHQVSMSDAMVTLIGKGWADVKDEQGNRRLDDPSDFVRFEIAHALQRSIPVLPVLLDGAPMPRASELPGQILALSLFQAMPLRSESVVRDAEAIAARLRALIAQHRSHGFSGWQVGLMAGAALLVGLLAGPFVLSQLRLPLLGVPATTEQESAPKERDEARAALASAQAQVADLQKQLEAASSEGKRLEQRVAETERERDEARTALTSVQAQVADLQKHLEAASAESKRLEQRLAETTREHDQARTNLATARDVIAKLAKSDAALALTAGSGAGFHDLKADGQPCPFCPELVAVPSGNFTMGAAASEGNSSERPGHAVAIARPFALGKFAVTRGEFAAFVNATGHKMEGGCNLYTTKWEIQQDRSWRSPPVFQQEDSHPVVCVSWGDAHAFVAWLSQQTGKPYRLPTEAEWEHAERAGTTTRFHFGSEEAEFCRFGNAADQTAKKSHPSWPVLPCSDGYVHTAPVGSFLPNQFGLYDMIGNARQWVEDCYHESYDSAPSDGSAWTEADCKRHVIRGAAWTTFPEALRSSLRSWGGVNFRCFNAGFRVARTLTP
jgi:formylglycine-generating enzyme required for sulfatase activity